MPFPLEAIFESLEDCFSKSGAADLDNFLSNHLTARKWIIASDFNIRSPGTSQDVYAFACFPMDKRWEELRSTLTTAFPRDFKDVPKITREQKRFFEHDRCFCFAFLIPSIRALVRSPDHTLDLAEARDSLRLSIEIAKGAHHPDHVAALHRIYQEAQKKSFSVSWFENTFLLCVLHAFVTGRITFRSSIDQVGWFPDRDSMTTACHGAWFGWAVMLYESLWRTHFGIRQRPEITTIDHRVNALALGVDHLIRIPDFFAAVMSRWDVDAHHMNPPPGAKDRAIGRYLDVMEGWLPESRSLWVSRIRFEEVGITTERIIGARTP